MSNLYLLPQPVKMCVGEGMLSVPEEMCVSLPDEGCEVILDQLRDGFAECGVVVGSDESNVGLSLTVDDGLATQGYHLKIGEGGIDLRGGDSAGLYYGVQTLRQLIRQCGPELPFLEIDDKPDYEVRGVYHDVSRGKVPTLETLCELVEKLAHYKINQFQLYIEHTFAFENHSEIWAGCDPLTHDDIKTLDAFCAFHHVEFVPSLSTFGHCYRVICNERNKTLNELDVDATAEPFSYRDAMTHYTLDCRNPQSLELVQEMITEYARLFMSDKFNICCDETFDLGKGKNAEEAARVGAGTLYADYLTKVIQVVKDQNRIPMFWGDIILNHPELLERVPSDAIVLHWDYSPNVSAEKCQVLADSKVPFYVCSGVHGWRVWTNMLDWASTNITRFAQLGRDYGAIGFLNTDWGDIGHPNMLAGSYHGFVLGAACSWHVASVEPGDLGAFDRAFCALELGDPTGNAVELLRRVGRLQRVTWGDISMWRDRSVGVPAEWRDEETGFPMEVLKQELDDLTEAETELCGVVKDLRAVLEDASPSDELACDELICGAEGALLMSRVGVLLKKLKDGAAVTREELREQADALRMFERQVCELWHLRNRPSEYYRLKCDIMHAAQRLDAMSNEVKGEKE